MISSTILFAHDDPAQIFLEKMLLHVQLTAHICGKGTESGPESGLSNFKPPSSILLSTSDKKKESQSRNQQIIYIEEQYRQYINPL